MMLSKTGANERDAGIAIQTHFEEMHAVLGIYISNKCNIECGHCGAESGPKEKVYLKSDVFCDQLHELVKEGVIKGIHVSGGEPFLFWRELERIGIIAGKNDLLFAINTNGFWAKDRARALERLLLIRPTQIILSTDQYHLEFIEMGRVVVAAKAAVELGIRVTIVVCTVDGHPSVESFLLEKELGAEVFREIEVGTTKLEYYGRARNLPQSAGQIMQDSCPEGACYRIGRPTVLQDGRVLACCNNTISNVGADIPLILGNVHHDSLRDLLRLGRKSPWLRAIRVLGPGGLAALLPAKYKSLLPERYPDGDICSICSAIMQNARVREAIEDVISEPSVRRVIDLAWELNIEPSQDAGKN